MSKSPDSDDIPGLAPQASPWKESNDDEGSGTPKGSPIQSSPGQADCLKIDC